MKYIASLLLLFVLSHPGAAQVRQADSLTGTNTLLKQDTVAYSTLYFYRSFIPKFNAPIKKVPILINDTLVHSLKANTMVFLKIFRPGRYRIAVDQKGDTQIVVNIKMGQEYFFRCEIVSGLWGGKPQIEPVTPAIGKTEVGMVAPETSSKKGD